MRTKQTVRTGPAGSGSGLALVVLLCTLLATLVGCGKSASVKSPRPAAPLATQDEPTPRPALAAGTCWSDDHLPESLGEEAFGRWVREYAGGDPRLGDSMRDDAAFSKPIDCARPHALEVYNVIELDPALTARVRTYAALLDQRSGLYRKIRDQVNDRCMASSPYGKAQRRAGAIPVQLGPSLSTTGGLHVAWDPFPADLWTAGQAKFVCTFQQDQPGALRFADVTTKKVPVRSRVCLNTPGRYVPCRGRHQAEDIAEMVLNTAIETGRLRGRAAVRRSPKGAYVALTDAEYARLDKVCSTFLSSVARVRGGVVARAYPGAASQWPTKTGAYVASCFALKPFEPPTPITGTVFDRG